MVNHKNTWLRSTQKILNFYVLCSIFFTSSCLNKHGSGPVSDSTLQSSLSDSVKQKFLAAITSLAQDSNIRFLLFERILENPDKNLLSLGANQGMILPRMRIIDHQGLILAQLDPNLIRLELGNGSLYDLIYQSRPLMNGDPKQGLRLVYHLQPSADEFFRNDWTVFLSKFNYALLFKSLDEENEWSYKNPLPRSEYSRMNRDENIFFKRQFSWVKPTESCRGDENSGWLRRAQIRTLNSRKSGIQNKNNVDIEVHPVKFTENFKGGDKVNFNVLLNCRNSNHQSSDTRILAPAKVTVQEIVDKKTTVNGIEFKTSEAMGYLDNVVFGRDPICVVGRTVFDSSGNIYGVITAYNPISDVGYSDFEKANNLVITTIKDERLGTFISTAYKSIYDDFQEGEKLTKSIDPSKPIQPWSDTSEADSYDPDYIQTLRDDSQLKKIAIQRAWRGSCQSRDILEARCEQEINLLKEIRGKFPPIRPNASPSSQITCRLPNAPNKIRVPACPSKIHLKSNMTFPY